MGNDLISVIVPVYNVEKYLENCVDSIIKQTYKNIEIILVDDGSSDNSGNLCDNFMENDSRIKVYHKKNGGLSDARNYGIKKANGSYITFIDSDDTIDNDYIEYLFSLIEKYHVDLSICTYSVITDDKKISYIDEDIEVKLDKITALKELLCENKFSVSACAKIYKKELFYNIEFPKGKLCEDNGTTYKLIEKCDYVAYGSKSKYNYYKRSNSIMTSSFNERKFDLIDLVDNMKDELEIKYPELHDVILKKQILARFSILRQIVLSDYKNEEKINEIINFIMQNKKFILKNKNISKREKIALISLMFGKNVFKMSWLIYAKIKY